MQITSEEVSDINDNYTTTRLSLTLKMMDVKTGVIRLNNSPIRDYTHSNDHIPNRGEGGLLDGVLNWQQNRL